VPALIPALKDKANQTNLNTFLFTIQHQVALALGKASAGTAQGVPPLMEALQALREEKRYAETSRMQPAAQKKPREQLYQQDAQAARSPSRARNSPDSVLGMSTVGLLGSTQGQGPYLATLALLARSTLNTKPLKTILEIIES